MPSPDYLPLALDLPAVYRADQAAFDQLDSYLGLSDALLRDRLTDLADAERWLSPDGLRMWPPGTQTDAAWPDLARAYLAAQDELAAWTGLAFPVTWPADAEGLTRRRSYLQRAARIWRRRASPAGLVDWFSLAFSDALGGSVPDLVEHFRVVDPAPSDPDAAASLAQTDPWLRATLFVRGDGPFAGLSRRRQAIAFVDRYAPAHVHVRVCWVDPDGFALPAPPAPGDAPAVVAAWQEAMRTILCGLVSFVDHAHAIRVWTCQDQGTARDQLGVGALPGGGTTPDH